MIHKRLLSCVSIVSVTFFTSMALQAEESTPLPDPLTLEAALDFEQLPHPDISYRQHALDIAKEEMGLAGASNDLEIRATAEARYIEPPQPLADLGREDHRLVISAEKTLYDFGRTGHLQQAAANNLEVAEMELSQAIQLRRIAIMHAFFDVILSDLQYNYDNESMAISYIQYDRAKDRQELGQVSEINTLQLQSDYMEVRRNRFRSEAAKRTTRVKMSEVLDRPNQLISRFIPPKLNYHEYKLVETPVLEKHALENNLELLVLRKKREQAREIMNNLRANRNPSIFARAEAGVYSREIGSNDAWRLGIGIDVPLYQGSRVDHALAAQVRRIEQLDLDIYQKEQALKNEILSLWLDIDVLLKQRQSSETELDYRELYLDRARSLYEMEVKTDLGDSMVALTRAAKYAAETDYEIALKWERLRYLTQMKLEEMRQ